MMYEHQRARLYFAAAMSGIFVLAACSGRDDAATVDSAATATAATTDSAAMTASGTTMTDANIFSALTATNTAEITSSKEALTKAVDPDVKAFAQMMIDDHQTMLTKGDALARTLNVTPVPGEMARDVNDDAKDDAKDMKDEAGRDFDDEYIDNQIEAHEETLELLDKANNSTATAEVKALIAEARPKVQAHLDRAKVIKDKID